jgi:hypothetical protein
MVRQNAMESASGWHASDIESLFDKRSTFGRKHFAQTLAGQLASRRYDVLRISRGLLGASP